MTGKVESLAGLYTGVSSVAEWLQEDCGGVGIERKKIKSIEGVKVVYKRGGID